ncbi:MAG: dihydrofolate reductase family protein, partial [Bacteroidia bacterium]
YGMKEFMARVDTVLFGRKSYEVMLQFDANLYPGKKNIVFSSKLEKAQNAEVVKSNPADKVRELKAQQGKDIFLFGGAQLMDALMKENLVDELHLSVHPIILGGGKSLFMPAENRTKLKLLNSKTYETGLVQLIYALA